jgi:hypothetical protein
MLDETTVVVEVAGRRYLATRGDDLWTLYAIDDHGAVIDPHRPSAYALTAGEAWTRGVPAAAELPIDELVVVAADERGRLGHHLLSAICPPELVER